MSARSAVVALALVLALPITAAAQVQAGVEFHVGADTDPQFAVAYRVFANDVQAGPDVPVTAVSNGTIRLTATVPVQGTYRIIVAAINGIGLQVLSEPPTLFVTATQAGGGGACTAGWTLDGEGRTLYLGIYKGGIGSAYACAGPMLLTLYVLGQDNRWYEWVGPIETGLWTNPVATLPGPQPTTGLVPPGALRLR